MKDKQTDIITILEMLQMDCDNMKERASKNEDITREALKVKALVRTLMTVLKEEE